MTGSLIFLFATQIGGTQTNALRPTKCDCLPGIGTSMVKPCVGIAPPCSLRARLRMSSSCLRLTWFWASTPNSEPTVG